MQEAHNLMRQVFALLQCSRRKTEPAATKGVSTPAKHSIKKKGFEHHYDSDDTTRSTEPGDFSNNENDFSELSSHTDSSLRSSGRRRAVPKGFCAAKPPGLVTPGPPGFRAPPGLEGQPRAPAANAPARHAGQSLNVNATSFAPRTNEPLTTESVLINKVMQFAPAGQSGFAMTPSQGFNQESRSDSAQLRNSIKMLKGVLEEWEASLPADPPPLAPADSSDLVEALAKLSQEQARTVRAMLDNRLTSPGTQPSCTQPTGQSAPRPSKRTFTPFGTNSRLTTQPGSQYFAAKAAPAAPDGEEEESLRTQLRDLADIDNSRVVMVRKINLLGSSSAEALQKHFAQFGAVERVMAAPTRSKQKKARLRPAPLGFIVMKTTAEANAVLAHGEQHTVQGETIDQAPMQAVISVLPFTSHSV